MFIYTAKMPRRALRAALLVLLVLLALGLCLRLAHRDSAAPSEREDTSLLAATDEARCAYLASLGWEVDPEPVELLHLTLPDELVEPYLSYNRIQLSQGFDLTPCCGETLERCTYRVNNYPGRARGCQADLYLLDGVIVAGDIVCTGADGFIDTLEYPTGEQDG